MIKAMLMPMLVLTATLVVTSAQATAKQDQAKKRDAQSEKQDLEEMSRVCGCAPKFVYNWREYKTDDDLLIPSRTRRALISAMENSCQDDAAKKNFCAKVKTVKVKRAVPQPATLKAGVLSIERTADETKGSLEELVR